MTRRRPAPGAGDDLADDPSDGRVDAVATALGARAEWRFAAGPPHVAAYMPVVLPGNSITRMCSLLGSKRTTVSESVSARLIFLATAMTVAMTSLAVRAPRTTSSNFITLAGLKKCMPTTSCGRLVKLAI